MHFPTIAIVGGGPGGLVLARVLQVHGFPATIYELDASVGARDQGGTLDLHEASGQRAMHEAGLFDQFRRLARAEGEDLRILDKTGKVWLDEVAEDGDGTRPEIDRTALRHLLVASVDAERIRWGHKVTAVSAQAGGRHELAFADGSTIMVDLVVGADGAWSKVRQLVSGVSPEYTGISFVEWYLSDVDRQHPASAALVGRGSLFALSEHKGLIAQRNGDGRIRVYAGLRVPADWITASGISWRDAPAARAALLDLFDGWSDTLTDLIRNGDDTIVPRPIYALPTGHSWSRVPGVTLLGDAAHLMSPFAGEGANLAMRDAAELALAIIAHPDDIEAALTTYEAALFPRSAEAAAESAKNLEECFRDDAPQGLLAQMARYKEGRERT